MIEIRKTTQKEKAKHNNMAYVIDLGHTKQWFTEKALVELLDKLHKVVNECEQEQLRLHNVSQRSELLAFAKEMQNIGFNEMDDVEMVVDIYIKANCG